MKEQNISISDGSIRKNRLKDNEMNLESFYLEELARLKKLIKPSVFRLEPGARPTKT